MGHIEEKNQISYNFVNLQGLVPYKGLFLVTIVKIWKKCQQISGSNFFDRNKNISTFEEIWKFSLHNFSYNDTFLRECDLKTITKNVMYIKARKKRNLLIMNQLGFTPSTKNKQHFSLLPFSYILSAYICQTGIIGNLHIRIPV